MGSYRCMKCNDAVAEFNSDSAAKYFKRAMPVGVGSGLYMQWLCFDCDPAAVEKYAAENKIAHNLGNTPWLDAKTVCSPETDNERKCMKPYQEIGEVKRETADELMKLWPMFQKIADNFSEKTGGAIMGFSINLVDVTEFGRDEKKSIVTGSRMIFAD